ncbi:MAG: DUF1844 domain-containing protein [Calditrichaeota bacterium]|nr:DUF1844 domain-containing protein [Calditrichota bacterium]
MAQDISNDQKNEILFLQLIMTFETAAWQQMGKIKNPLTDKIERDLNQAQLSIDMLDMIKAKTQGNLTENEIRVLDRTLSELKLNFVDELEKERKEQEKKAQEKAQEEKKPASESEKKENVKEEEKEKKTDEGGK